MDSLLEQLGFNQKQVELSALSIVGRLVHPASENRTRRWAQNLSAIDELLDSDFSHLSNNALYRISDLLFAHKGNIENHLAKREKNLFALEEKIILNDNNRWQKDPFTKMVLRPTLAGTPIYSV